MDNNNKSKKEQISSYKKKADEFNRSLYSDIASFRKGLLIVLIIASTVLISFLFLN
jgi:hypothetical protein